MKKLYLLIAFCLLVFNLQAQFTIEKIHFESANPYSFNDIITDLEKQEKQKVFGELVIPKDSIGDGKKYPLIIGVAGSLGWGEHHYKYLEMYQEMGIATFELNSFKSRSITSTVGTQNEITMAAMILDAYRAFEVLAEHPRIDKNKVSITGWSLGGGVTLFSAWLPLKEAINKNNLKEIADALTDILYVTNGAGHAFGINLDKCFTEVQSSNMSKLGNDGKPIYNENGKVMKGPNYFEPNLSKFI